MDSDSIRVARTFTEKVQLVFAGRVAPDTLITAVAGTALMVPPPHEPVRPFGFETTRLPGRLSVKPTPVSGAGLGFESVKLRLTLAPIGTVVAPKLLEMVGGSGSVTVRVAEAVFPKPPSVEVTFEVTLFLTPAVVALTRTTKVHSRSVT